MKRRLLLPVILIVGCCHTLVAQFKLYEKGHDNYTAGKYEEAIGNFTEYLTKYTRDKALDADVFYLRALSYYKTKDYTNAISDFEETILRNHPNVGNIYWFKAKCHDALGATDDAIGAYGSAIRELGANREAKAKLLYERSLLYSKKKEYTLAYADLMDGRAAHDANSDIKKEIDRFEKQNLVSRSAYEALQKSKTTTTAVATKAADPGPDAATAKNEPAPAKNSPAKKEPVVKKNEPAQQSEPVAKKENTRAKKTESAPPVEKTVAPVAAPATTAVVAAPSLAEFYKDEKRFALVIGNSAYPKNIGALKNPVNDATDMAKELQNSNFDVDLLTNATYGQIRAALLKFKEKIDGGDPEQTVALFYFAGHGVQHDDENYLVPTDAVVEFEDDIARYCFPTQRMVLGNMERSNARMNIVILDACRNNPFPALNRSVQQGLGDMRRARGSFIAYATAPGSVASDGVGRNGLYTQELLKAMRKPGLTIEQVFKEVRANVLRLSGDRQNTWDSSNIIGEFYFKFK